VTARLTSREWEVLDLVSRNHSTTDIACELHLSKSAVRVHIAAAVRKLGAENRQAAVALFRERSGI
jgi:DNA-binding NarL/FixJ family response regulator